MWQVTLSNPSRQLGIAFKLIYYLNNWSDCHYTIIKLLSDTQWHFPFFITDHNRVWNFMRHYKMEIALNLIFIFFYWKVYENCAIFAFYRLRLHANSFPPFLWKKLFKHKVYYRFHSIPKSAFSCHIENFRNGWEAF